MCLGIPGKVRSVNGSSAVIDIMGVTRNISIALLEKVHTGEYVVVHAGCAISHIDEEEALELLSLFEELGVTDDE